MSERITLGGTDGFRGPAALDQPGPGLVNEETFAGLSAALINTLHETGEQGIVVVASDTRPSGRELKAAVIDGVRSQGAEVLDLGVAPTPTAQKTAKGLGAMATIVVTASHNKVGDNGWKGMIGSDKPFKSQVTDISDRYWDLVDQKFVATRTAGEQDLYEREKSLQAYKEAVVADVREAFDSERPLEGKIIAIDGAFGAAQELMPAIMRELGATVEEFACDNTGVINEGCGATELNGLQNFIAHRPDLLTNPNFLGGLANDGDADRVMAMGVVYDDRGARLQKMDGNHFMWALAQEQPGIIGTEYTNSGLVTRLRDDGVGFEYCANGDVFVTAGLRDKQASGELWTRGGEFTGHHVDTDWLSSGDGLRTGAWVAAWAVQKGMTFGDIYQELPLWHEEMNKIDLGKVPGKIIDADEEVQRMLGQIKDVYGSSVRIHARSSGTEPVYRVWGEGEEETQVLSAVRLLAGQVRLRRDSIIV